MRNETTITPLTAKELQSRSVQARKLRAQLRAEMEVRQTEGLTFEQITLTRTRNDISLVQSRMRKLLETNPDGKELNQLAQALARLCEIEQKHAMRPSPGSLKPVAPRKSSHTAPVEPDEPS